MLKTVSSIVNALGALNYKGTWNASTNSPALASGAGTKGDYYVVSVAGTTALDGISNWGVGDWATFNGSVWQRVEGGADLNGVNLSVSGTTNLAGLTASTSLALDSSKNVVSVTNTGSGDNVLSNSPTLVTPALGTPSSGVVTNLTGTASININGTVGATTRNSGAFTTLSATGDTTVESVFAGCTAPPFGSAPGAALVKEPSFGRLQAAANTTSARNLCEFYNPNGLVGTIVVSGGTTSYNSPSDYRLKHDIRPMTGALDKVAALHPVTYKWNADNSQSQGFIAHELQEVVPECVKGAKDAVDAEGKPVYQSMDTSFLVATLVAAIQELKAEFDAYKVSHP